MMQRLVPVAACGLAITLAACSVDVGTTAFSSATTPAGTTTRSFTARAGTEPAVLGPDGRCTADVSLDPSSVAGGAPGEISLGMGECALVRIKGQPTDVLVGQSGKGQREVQVLYSIPGAKEVYLFTDNRLTKIVR